MWSKRSNVKLNDKGLGWLRQQGALAGLMGAGLILSDLFLPMPAPGLMTALGQIYGWFIGGMYAALGSTGVGTLGEKEPLTTILLATALPILIFPPIWLLIQKRSRKAVAAE